MSSSRTKREPCPEEYETAAPAAANQQQPLQRSRRDKQTLQLQQEQHSVVSTTSHPQHPPQQLQPVTVSEAYPLPSKHSPLQQQEEQRLRVQEEPGFRQQRQHLQRRATAGKDTETRPMQPAQAGERVTFDISAAGPAGLRGSKHTHLSPTASSESHRENPSSSSRLDNSNRSPIDVRSHSGSADTSDGRKSYRSGDGSISSNATTASSGSVNSNRNSTDSGSSKITGGSISTVERVDLAERNRGKECEKNPIPGSTHSDYCKRNLSTSLQTSADSCSSSDGSMNTEADSRHCPPGIKTGCPSSSGHSSSSSTRDSPNATKSHQAREESLSSRSTRAAAAGASATKREPAAGKTVGRSGRQERCYSGTKGEQQEIAVTGKTGSHGEVEASCGRSAEVRNDSVASSRQRADQRDEGHSAEERATGSATGCGTNTTMDKSNRHIAVMYSPAAGTDETKKKSEPSINISSTSIPSKTVAHGMTSQREQGRERMNRGEQQRRPYRLTLSKLRAATGPGFLALEKRRSSATVEATLLDPAGSTRRGLQRSGGDSSSCLSTEFSGTSHFGGRTRGIIFPLGGAAAEARNPATAYANRIERGDAAAEEEEETTGMPARDAALLAAEALARKIRGHGRQRSASHQPVGLQSRSHQAELSGAEHAPAREHINSHWLWCEFFLHALHYSNKGATKVKQHAAETAAAAAHKIGRHHFGSGSREGEAVRTGGEPTGAGERIAHADGHAFADSGLGLPATAHGAFSSASGLAARHLTQTHRSAEPTSGSTAAAAGKKAAEAHEVASATERIGKHLHDDYASGHSVTTAILHSAVQAVKSLPYTLRREWMYLMRARKNSAHVNHAQRMQRAADVQHDLSSAGFHTAEGDRSSAGAGKPAGTLPMAAEQRRGREWAAGAPATRRSAALQQQRYVDSMPAVAGRFYPKNQRERAKDLQALLHMHQVLPCRETRIRLLQHVQRNIDKGRRDFEQASPLLSLRREQLLPCGRSFIVRCLQQDSASATRIHRKYLTAGRLIGGGSEAMVFAAVETPFPESPPSHSRLGDLLTWDHMPNEDTSRSIPSKHTPAPSLPTAAGTGTAAPGGNGNADSGNRTLAAPIRRAAEIAGTAAAPGAGGAGWPQRGVANEGRQPQYGNIEGRKILVSRKGGTGAVPLWQGEHAGPCSRPPAGAASQGGTKGEADFIEVTAAAGGMRGHEYSKGVEEARTLTSGSSAHQEWAICWALKWFLCEPFLLRSRSRAEQEGTVVDWLQMALWRLVPFDSINADVIYELGILAPQWIGFIEGVSLVCPGDARFALLNRVAGMPLMLGDLLTVPPLGLTVSDRLYCVMRLIQIVANLHAMGVLHNDVKLENILIGTDGTLHLGDLGSVTPFTGRPTRFQRIGTDVYLDPQTAQNFLEYERREYEQQNQQQPNIAQRAQRDARGDAQQQAATIVTGETAAPQRKPEAGIETGGSAAGRITLKHDAAAEVKEAAAAAANARNRRAGGTNTSDVRRCADGNIQEIQAAKEGDAGRSEGRNREVLKAQGKKAADSPFRIVYTPMRDAWAAGIVCYYIWCGGLLPYNLSRAFAGELADHDLFEYLAQLPKLHRGNRVLFPLGSCPDGETEELLEVRRIIEGLLEPDGAIRKTPLEIVQESFLFKAYRSSSFNENKGMRT